jgi:NAD(P)-dependent dehydrogenase (short-subunit alcohol dehydrogenase family)
MKLKNSVALVTGGSSGIGRVIAKTLLESGARLAITGRNQERLAEAARELGAYPIRADVSVEADVERTYDELMRQFRDLDILVNNAGVGVYKNLADFGLKEFECYERHWRDAHGAGGGKALHREAARKHREHLFDGRIARRCERHCVLH